MCAVCACGPIMSCLPLSSIHPLPERVDACPTAMAVTAGTRLGRYEIRSLLGAGGMGEVYLAWDMQLERTVALKILPLTVASDQQMRRFIQEAKAVSALNHPNILTIYEIGHTNSETPFIATEFIDGLTLRQHMASRRMKLTEALDVAVQVATALAAAHAAGIVHRDIKPENIMVRRDALVKVLDFGIAKLTGHQGPMIHPEAATMQMPMTTPGMVMGTPKYMSPEQARGIAVDERTDIWSLGVVLYEMVAGRAPFEGLTISDMIVSVLEREPPPLTRLSPEASGEIERIAGKALRKNSEERYQTAKDLALDLKNLGQKLEFEAELGRSVDLSLKDAVARSVGSTRAITESAKESGSISATAGRTLPASRRRRSRKAINSLAVLPLANASADATTEYLSDGITESIINSLSQLPSLRVMASSTVFHYKGQETDPLTLGRDLGVRAVLTGRVLQLGDTLVIRTELVDVADGAQLWGEQYHRKLTDILAVQDEISREISEKLRMKLTGEEKKRLTKRHTENAAAYQLYLKGRYYWNRRTEEGFKKAIDFFNQAIEEDSAYALAYAGLADCYALLGSDEYGALPAQEAMPKAKAAAVKALEIDDTLAEAHTSLAYVTWVYEWDTVGAEREYKRAIELNPNYATAHHWYAISYLTALGRHQEALAEMKRAHELDPLSLIINSAVGWAFYFARQYDRAIEQYQKTLELDPNFSVARAKLAWAYEQKSMYEEATAELQQAVNLSRDRTWVASLGYTYAVSGKREETQKVVNKLKELSEQQHVPPYDIALIYAGLGDKDRAFEWLTRACEERSSWLVWLRVDPRFDSLHVDQRFTDLLRHVGLTQ